MDISITFIFCSNILLIPFFDDSRFEIGMASRSWATYVILHATGNISMNTIITLQTFKLNYSMESHQNMAKLQYTYSWRQSIEVS